MSDDASRRNEESTSATVVIPDAEREALDSVQLRFRLASIWVAVALTVIVCLGAEGYVLATPDRPSRLALALLVGVGMLTAPVILLLPRERIVRSRWREPFFLCWSAGLIAVITAMTAVDGGAASPLRALFVLTLIFAGLSYPPRSVLIVGLLSVGGYGVVALVDLGSGPDSAFAAFALVCAVVLSTWQARNHRVQDERLSRTAKALRDSESVSRLRALQQEQVAVFGQSALAGSRIADLMEVAVGSIQRTLGVEIAAILEYREEDDNFLIRAGAGMPADVVGQATVPAGRGSQAGFTMLSDEPVIVRDWARETRFVISEPLRRSGSGTAPLRRGGRQLPAGDCELPGPRAGASRGGGGRSPPGAP